MANWTKKFNKIRGGYTKRLAAAAATVGMMASMVSPAWAAIWNIAEGDIKITAKEDGQYVSQGDIQDQLETDETIITGTSTKNTVTIEAKKDQTADVTLDGLNIDVSSKSEAAITIKGEGDVNLELDGENKVESGKKHAGIEKNDSDSTGTLTIDDANEDDGSLKATGGLFSAGIGGSDGQDTSKIMIDGGTIEAVGKTDGAGIGGGANGDGEVTINGGTVTATGGSYGAGIGGGEKGNGKVTINGGDVTATGGNYGAGIGGGQKGDGEVTINGGTVTADGGKDGAGIGGGDHGGVGTVVVKGGKVTATAGNATSATWADPDAIGTGGYQASSPKPQSDVSYYDGTIVEQPYGWSAENHKTHTFNCTGTNACETTYACICGATKTVYNHNMEYSGTTEPTCTTAGAKHYTCTNTGCSYTKDEPLAPLGHSWGNGIVTTPATCETEGVMEYHCIRESCENGLKTKKIPKLNHVWDDGVVTQEPTCTQEGEKTYTCTRGCTKTEPIPCVAENHVWDEGVVTKQPTTAEEGTRTYTCSHCSLTRTESIPKLAETPASVAALSVTTLSGTAQPYEQSVADGRAVLAAPAQDAILTGSLGALAELKARGATTLVFRTALCETSVSIDKLLAAGSADDVFVLTHKGTQAVLTVEGRVVE